nr:MAG TPA: hypothetical protein [Caudoviricetes sp.]
MRKWRRSLPPYDAHNHCTPLRQSLHLDRNQVPYHVLQLPSFP